MASVALSHLFLSQVKCWQLKRYSYSNLRNYQAQTLHQADIFVSADNLISLRAIFPKERWRYFWWFLQELGLQNLSVDITQITLIICSAVKIEPKYIKPLLLPCFDLLNEKKKKSNHFNGSLTRIKTKSLTISH